MYINAFITGRIKCRWRCGGSVLHRRAGSEREGNNEYCTGLLVIPLKASVWSNLCCPARASNSQLAGTRLARARHPPLPPPSRTDRRAVLFRTARHRRRSRHLVRRRKISFVVKAFAGRKTHSYCSLALMKIAFPPRQSIQKRAKDWEQVYGRASARVCVSPSERDRKRPSGHGGRGGESIDSPSPQN